MLPVAGASLAIRRRVPALPIERVLGDPAAMPGEGVRHPPSARAFAEGGHNNFAGILCFPLSDRYGRLRSRGLFKTPLVQVSLGGSLKIE